MMRISVITWDASFREKFHTVDTFCNQHFNRFDFEFIWVDFYNNSNKLLNEKIANYPNASLLNLKNFESKKWHLGKCMNEGVKHSKGDIIVLADGDIIVEKDHLETICTELENDDGKVVFFRRWDEPKEKHCAESYKIDFLQKHTKLFNATNYAGCYAMKRTLFDKINGFEEHEIFAGPGANGMETYLRLRNAGASIKWHEKKIFHPWHFASGTTDKITGELIELSKIYKWLNPYSGILQSWALKERELDLTFIANDGTLDSYRKRAPNVTDLRKKNIGFVKNLINKLKK